MSLVTLPVNPDEVSSGPYLTLSYPIPCEGCGKPHRYYIVAVQVDPDARDGTCSASEPVNLVLRRDNAPADQARRLDPTIPPALRGVPHNDEIE